ncbi:MAG: reverse transcriptase family protein, partial [Candidatus Thiodiazotropha sp.]
MKPFKLIFEKSIEENKIPDIWKSAYVTSIFKSGSKFKPENYRPISLTSVPGKILERLIRDELVNHMKANSFFSKSQHGFLAGRSCTTQLLEFLEDVTTALDNGEDVDVIYLDFCKAFDKVPHKRLLKKLWGYGIRGNIYSWILDFLSDRKQYVKVCGISSDPVMVTSGVPQGSVLGPILFLIYINDLPEVISAITKLFADDAKIYRSIATNQHIAQVQLSVDEAVAWADTWEMFFNFKKCKHLHIGTRQDPAIYKMKCGQESFSIEKCTSERDLGVTVDQALNFSEHISCKVSKANRNLGIIFRTFTFMDKEMFLNLYKSIVRP